VSSDGAKFDHEASLPPPRVVYADDAIVVVDKPSGMPSVPARTPLDPPAVAVRLADSFGPLEAVHRLDRDTSGLLILARDRQARAILGIAFEQRRVGKRYLAVIAGQPPDPSGTIALPIAPDRASPPRHRVDHAQGRPATTSWRVIATRQHVGRHLIGCSEHPAPTPVDQAVSLMELEPLTGRSHQLRVHLAAIGCPILGDRLYGEPPWNDCCSLALHAANLAFDHPTTGERIMVMAPPPQCPPWRAFAAEIMTASAAWPSG
jgi:tRNA pseudouridine32 synthase/23S rRNA pseudouridine746 synthase